MFKVDRNKVFWRTVEDETVILNIDTGLYYTLAGTGKAIWEMIVDGKGHAEILAKIASRFDVDEKTAARDLDGFIKVLNKEDLIERGA